MMAELLVTLFFTVLICISTVPLNNESDRDTCKFKDCDSRPTFVYSMGGEKIDILCSVDSCHCDGSSTGYTGCQNCCCTIRERTEENNSANKTEDKDLRKDCSKSYLSWAISMIVVAVLCLLVLAFVMIMTKRRLDKYKAKLAENTETQFVSRFASDSVENTAIIEAAQTVFPPVETIHQAHDNIHNM